VFFVCAQHFSNGDAQGEFVIVCSRYFDLSIITVNASFKSPLTVAVFDQLAAVMDGSARVDQLTAKFPSYFHVAPLPARIETALP
jgi:hypothetical protein